MKSAGEWVGRFRIAFEMCTLSLHIRRADEWSVDRGRGHGKLEFRRKFSFSCTCNKTTLAWLAIETCAKTIRLASGYASRRSLQSLFDREEWTLKPVTT